MAKLTLKQRKFAKAIADGLPQQAAARVAGYADNSPQALRTQASRLMHLPDVLAEAHRHREQSIAQTATRALSCLASIIDNEAAPAPARVSASKWVLEAAGHGLEAAKLLARIGEGDDKSVSQLSAADLEHLVMMAADKVRFARAAAIDAEVIGGDATEQNDG
jgi:hypothetical protein